jgi:hypothetical protein
VIFLCIGTDGFVLLVAIAFEFAPLKSTDKVMAK